MANDDFARGLVPLNLNPFKVHVYKVSTGTDLFLGMPVDLAASGFLEPVAVSSAGAVTTMGVVVGFLGTLKRGLATNDPFLDVSDLTPPTPTSDTGDRFAVIADDPDQEYFIQGDTGGTLFAAADLGLAVTGLYRATSGNVETGWANLEFDADSGVASNSGMLLTLRHFDQINTDGTENTVAANYQKVVVKLLHHRKNAGVIINPV